MGFLQNVRPSVLEGLGQKMRRGFEKKDLKCLEKQKVYGKPEKQYTMELKQLCHTSMMQRHLFHIYYKFLILLI